MQLRPFPTKVPSAIAETLTKPERDVFCSHYNDCLNCAVKEDWENWTCSRCQLFRIVAAPSAERFANDRTRDPDWR